MAKIMAGCMRMGIDTIQVVAYPNLVDAVLEAEEETGHKFNVIVTLIYQPGVDDFKMLNKLNLQAGILGWVLEGGSVFDKKGKTNRIHVYGPKWNYPPEGYDAVW